MTDQSTRAIPVLPLRDVVVYPHMVIPLFVGREKSINALDTAMQEDKKILLIAQKNAEIDDPAVLSHQLKMIPGVVETGLFVDLAEIVYLGSETAVQKFEA